MNRKIFLEKYWRGELAPPVIAASESDAASNRGFLVGWWRAAVLCAGATVAAVGAFAAHPCPAHALAILAIWGAALVCMVRKVK